MRFDIVHAADPRFYGGSTSAVRVEIQAARQFGLSTALIPFLGVSNVRFRRFETRTAETLSRLNIPWLTGDEPVECDIVIAHHPFVFERMPIAPLEIRTKYVVCSVQHPPFDGYGCPQYDIATVQRNLERMFAAPVIFAPVGPKVRAQFENLVGGAKPSLLRQDLYNLINMNEWPERKAPPPRVRACVGRHSRPDLLKWPDTMEEVLGAYPDADNVEIKILGGVPDSVVPWMGSNWRVLPFVDNGISEFLGQLDFYVFFHSRRWVEAFGISIAEAVASGAVTILDRSFESLFEDGAVYARPEETLGLIDTFIQSPSRFAKQSQIGRRLVQEKFSTDTYPVRMRELYDNLELPLPPALSGYDVGRRARDSRDASAVSDVGRAKANQRFAKKKRVLCVATNGIGLGHITRLMAIAERMSPDVEPIFLTMSAGSSILSARGHPVDYIPSAPKIGATPASWNEVYAQELLAAIESFQVSAVVFDSNHPFPGLLNVLAARPDILWVWIRRGMWAPHHRLDPSMQHRFDMVIEPGEFASDEDRGITSTLRNGVIRVSPILLVDQESKLSRSNAAAALGVDPERTTAIVQLGSERNFDFDEARVSILSALTERGIQVIEALNPLAPPRENAFPGVLQKALYPIADYFNVVDLMITNAGYNSFHECIYNRVPSIFVPNEAPEMDEQHVRAAYAKSCGLALCLRSTDIDRVAQTIDLALSSSFRDQIRLRSNRLEFVNGASAAAAAIEELLFSVRTDRPLNASIARA